MDNNTYSTGQQGEEVASCYLTRKGYDIIERNYRSEKYEIDIIASMGSTIVFCEVKTARTNKFGSSVSWVTPEKIQHISKAAEGYIATHDTKGFSFRFDVIGLNVKNGATEITHIENAFMAPEVD